MWDYLRLAGLSEMVKVGRREPREVSDLNHELYSEIKNIMELGKEDYDWPYKYTGFGAGWFDLGLAIDWLEKNYEIKKKVRNEDE